MIEYEKGVPHRVGHFLKVYAFAKTIGELENLPADNQTILEIAAIVHDIGIRPSLEKYNSSAGPYQEKEGAIAARTMLTKLGFSEPLIERVSYLVAHHHTYTNVDSIEYQILLEADFLVNMLEEKMEVPQIQAALNNVFQTATGKAFCQAQYLSSTEPTSD
jgi:HD superfamily phosphodiesterase